jgi:hypothetical protein
MSGLLLKTENRNTVTINQKSLGVLVSVLGLGLGRLGELRLDLIWCYSLSLHIAVTNDGYTLLAITLSRYI